MCSFYHISWLLSIVRTDSSTAKADSDIDLKIEKGKLRSLFQISSFRLALEDALSLPVDLLTSESSDAEFLNAISENEVLLYQAT